MWRRGRARKKRSTQDGTAGKSEKRRQRVTRKGGHPSLAETHPTEPPWSHSKCRPAHRRANGGDRLPGRNPAAVTLPATERCPLTWQEPCPRGPPRPPRRPPGALATRDSRSARARLANSPGPPARALAPPPRASLGCARSHAAVRALASSPAPRSRAAHRPAARAPPRRLPSLQRSLAPARRTARRAPSSRGPEGQTRSPRPGCLKGQAPRRSCPGRLSQGSSVSE